MDSSTSTRNIRTIHVLAKLSPSGMERMLVSSAHHWQGGPDTVLVIGQGRVHPFADALKREGYVVSTIPSLKTVKGIRALRALISNHQDALVHIHTEGTYWQAVLAVRLARKSTPIVRTVHSMFDKKGLKKTYRWLQNKLTDPFVEAIVSCSKEVQDFELLRGRKTELVWNWVDSRYFTMPRSERLVPSAQANYLIVGNCSSIKNHETVLIALSRARSAGHIFSLSHFGDEAHASEIEKHYLDELQSEGVLLHRGIGDPIDSMVRNPTYLIPSTHEGMSVSLAEAIVAGIPVIAADSPGIRWAGEFSGVTVTANNEDEWLRAIWAVDANEALNFSGRAVERFRPAKGVEAYEQLYEVARS